MTPKQIKAAEFYAKATPKQARKRALRGLRVPLRVLQEQHNDDDKRNPKSE